MTPALWRSVGQAVSRYGLALTLAWIGFGKYVKMEARVLIEHSPLMSWVYHFFSVNTVARGLGGRGQSVRRTDSGAIRVARPVLLKDVVLMGVSIWTLGEALQAYRTASAFDADRDQVRDGSG